MGSDPFWPTYLASINVLCVPAASISPQRFSEVFDIVSSIQEIRVAEIDLDNVVSNDLIGASKYKAGSILCSYSSSLEQQDVRRFPLEPNSSPHVVLGIYDGEISESPAESDDDGNSRQIQVAAALQELKKPYQGSRNGRICRLLALNAQPEEDVLQVAINDQSTFKKAMQAVSCSLIYSISQMSAALPEIVFSDSQASSVAERPTEQVSSQTDVGSRTGTPQQLERPSQIPQQQSVPEDQRKGRYTIVLGLLNLYTGFWPDAMRRLDEGANLAREANDSLWQARALECLLICMALFAWKGEAFDIPEVCLKAHATAQTLARSESFPNYVPSGNNFRPSTSADLAPPRKWAKYAPIVARATLDLYSSISHGPGVVVAPGVLTESRIRLANLLLFAQLQGERIDEQAFDALFLHHSLKSPAGEPKKRWSPDPTLPILMLDALSAPVDGASDSHVLSALAAVIASLAQLGSSRRHAFLFRSLLQRLVPILLRARKIGASEAGMHPASALSTTGTTPQDDSHELFGNFKALLDAACAAYGIVLSYGRTSSPDLNASRAQMEQNVQSWYLNHATGDIALKLEMLQLCVSASDAMPDFKASLAFTSNALRCGLRSLNISMTSVNPRPVLLPEEQNRLVEGLKRTVSAAKRLGFDEMRADYWDDFLVRDVQLYQPPDAARLTSHKASELSLVEEGASNASRDPFIFNPFAKAQSTETIPVVVAGEVVTFSVILQNPLELETEIEDISLLTEGCGFVPNQHSILLGPFWSQVFSLTGTPRRSGSLTILGCRVTVVGCHQKDFPIIVQDWHSSPRLKQKSSLKTMTGPHSNAEDQGSHVEIQLPESKNLTIKVIEPQPDLMIKSLGLPQPSFMLLEGETKSFQLKISNESPQVPTDLLLFTYDDNVTISLQEALGKKDLLPIDTYEVQYQLQNRPTIKMAPDDVQKLNTECGSKDEVSYSFELNGRPGLVNAVVQMDFAHLGMPKAQVTQTFHTRQKRFPLVVTVNGSIDIPRCNLLPIRSEFQLLQSDYSRPEATDGRLSGHYTGEAYCMLSMDLRNVWPHTLSIELTSILRPLIDVDAESEHDLPTYVVQEDLEPGHISRVILLVPRLFIQDPYAAIPNLMTQRQFVVSASKLSLEAEAASRETFWYREELLKHISGTWKETKTGRHGQIDLRKGIRLNQRTIDVLKIDHVDVSFTVDPSAKAAEDAISVKQLGSCHFSVKTEAFVTVKVRVHNRSKDRLSLLLRLQPSLRDQPHNIALDLSRRLAWSGILQQALHPALEPGTSLEASLDLIVFAEGNYEVNATVEEIKGRTKTSVPKASDGVGVTSERRIWHARAPCLIDAFDPPPWSDRHLNLTAPSAPSR